MSRGQEDSPPADWDAGTYDRVADPQARWGRTVLDRLSLAGDETVLDAGCGTGRVTAELLARLPNGRVVALDASAGMLAEAARRVGGDPRVRLLRADLLRVDAEVLGDDAPVDAVFSTATFHWVLDHDRLFANLAAVLRPGGRLVAQCGAEHNIEGLLAIVRRLGVERAGSWFFASAEDTRRRLSGCGFVDVEVWVHDEPTPFATAAELRDFLEAVCLRETFATMAHGERDALLDNVVRAMPARTIDYVRLNILATKP